MRLKVLLLILFYTCVALGQGSYTYKNMSITATCNKGNVTYKENTIIFVDSCMDVILNMQERTLLSIIVVNKYSSEVQLNTASSRVFNKNKGFYAKLEPLEKKNISSSMETIYSGEKEEFLVSEFLSELFAKRKDDQHGEIHLCFVINNKMKYYDISLNAKLLDVKK